MLTGFQAEQERRIIGLMSGTSADGIDAAVVGLRETDDGLSVTVLAFDTSGYPDGLRAQIMDVSDPETSRIDELCRLHFELGELFAAAAVNVTRSAGLALKDIDLIGSHGQTVHHLPERKERFGVETGATLQIGDPIGDRTANRRRNGRRFSYGGRGPWRPGRAARTLRGLPALQAPCKGARAPEPRGHRESHGTARRSGSRGRPGL